MLLFYKTRKNYSTQDHKKFCATFLNTTWTDFKISLFSNRFSEANTFICICIVIILGTEYLLNNFNKPQCFYYQIVFERSLENFQVARFFHLFGWTYGAIGIYREGIDKQDVFEIVIKVGAAKVWSLKKSSIYL